MSSRSISRVIFFFNDTATTEIYTLSLHDALPISKDFMTHRVLGERDIPGFENVANLDGLPPTGATRSEEHTSELQSRQYLVCRLLLEKKNTAVHHVVRALRKSSSDISDAPPTSLT